MQKLAKLKTKVIIALVFLLFLFFFTNDLGLIDIEKTTIVTALSIDSEENGEYQITAQLAVPEATDTNSEKTKAQVSGRGATIAAAIKSISDYSGWYPQLSFCKLIILSNNFKDKNIITVIDYFARTLRIQDSALVVMADGSAREILEASSPLDNISSFALQKVLLKKPGFDRDVATCDIKTFCTGYYSLSGSSYMPIVKLKKDIASSSQSSTGSASTQANSGKSVSSVNKDDSLLFDAQRTALFKNGIKTGEISADLTLIYNLLTKDFGDGSIELKNINTELNKTNNYFIHIEENSKQIKVNITDYDIEVVIKLDLYCKISDQNSTSTDITFSKNLPLPPEVKKALKQKLEDEIEMLVQNMRSSNCDLLNIQERLYRYHHSKYNLFKDNYLSVMKTKVDITVQGQK